MDQDLHIIKELQQIAPSLIGLHKNVFVKQDNYFALFEAKIVSDIKSIQTELYFSADFPKKTALQAPSDAYFANLPTAILQKIKDVEEVRNNDNLPFIAPTLASLSKKQVYTLPSSYFEQLKITIPKQQAKIFSLKKLIQYSSAAAVAGILLIGGLKLNNSKSINNQYVMAKKVDVDKSINQISSNELQQALGTNELLPSEDTNETTVAEAAQLFNVTESLETVTNEELQTYLNQNIAIENFNQNEVLLN